MLIQNVYNPIMRVLVIEDDEAICSLLVESFESRGESVECAKDSEEAEYYLSTGEYDVMILDWMLPGESGVDFIERLRRCGVKMPVLMLSAKSDVRDRIEGLRRGCDDYLGKPFSLDELEARIEAIYRRVIDNSGRNEIRFGDMVIDLDKKELYKKGEKLELTRKELDLLLLLIKHRNSYISKSRIAESVWRESDFVNSNVVEVTIHNLRKKLGKEYIKSFRGLGYRVDL